MAEQAYAYVTLIPVAKGFQSKIASELGGIGGVGGSVGKQFSQGFGGTLKRLIGPAVTAAAGVAVTSFAKTAINEASNLAESINAVNVSFGANAAGIKQLGEDAATSLGLSNQQFNQLAVGFTAFAEKIAGPGGDVTKVIDDLTTRGADFASVMNLEVSDALTLLRSGLAGETEPLRRFGVDVSEAQVKAFAYANGIAVVGAELTEAQKVQARYGTVMEQTARMQGDFANTSDGLANGMRILKATIADTQAEVGNALLPAMQALIPAITPIVQQLAPMLTSIFEKLAPVITKVAENLSPLFDALSPLIEVFGLLMQTLGEILAAVLPPFSKILGKLTPIILKLVQAFLPLISAILPPLVRLIEAMIPAIELVATWLGDYWIPILAKMVDSIMPVVVYLIDLFARALEDLNTLLGPVFAGLKPIVDALFALAGIKPGDLKKEVVITTKVTSEFSAYKGGPGQVYNPITQMWETKPSDTPTPTPTPTPTATGPTPAQVVKKAIATATKAVKAAQKKYRAAIKAANAEFAKRSAEISENYAIAIARATIERDQSLAKALEDNAKRVADIKADFAKRLDDIIKQSMNRLRDAYRSAVEINVASIFDSDVVAGSIDGTIEMMRRKLTAARQLLANAAALAAAGFSQTFIEQVVGAGTEVGNELAQGILNATPEQQAEMRNLFNAIETEANSGMDALAKTIYDKNGLATQELRDLYAQTQADLVTALAEQEALYQQTVADIMARFEESVAEAKATRDTALAEAEEALQEALLKANDNFVAELKKIKKAFKREIADMKAEVAELSASISGLLGKISRLQTATASADLKTDRVPMAQGGLVTGPTNALIGEAGPELVIPLEKFESWFASSDNGKALNYYAAPNQSLDAEEELFQAMRRAKVVVGW